MKSKYRSKMIDSFKSKLRIFFFRQSFDENVANYIQKNPLFAITEAFENFELDPEISDLYAARYYQSNPDDMITFKNNTLTAKTLTDRLKMPIQGRDWYFNTSLLSLFTQKRGQSF